MKYNELIQNIKEPIFSLQDLALLGHKVIPSQLSALAKKGELIRLKNGLYAIASKARGISPEYIAFKLYGPSYVSLEWAMNRHGIMPDVPFHVTSVTAKPTRTFKTPWGNFYYRTIKKDYFFGYEKHEDVRGEPYLMADVEKTIIDYLYLHSDIKDADDIEGLRFNPFTMEELDRAKLKSYAAVYSDPRIDHIIHAYL